MKVQQVIATAAVLMLCPAAFAAHRNWAAPRIVTWNCSGCHGIDGRSQPPYFPRLAGLNADYAEKKIAEFQEAAKPPVDELLARALSVVAPKLGVSRVEARINMVGIAHGITAEDTKMATAWYAKQEPIPGRAGDPALLEQGKALFLNGLHDQGLPACMTCHGAEAEGKGSVPRLAGQNGSYILSELAKFNAGDRKHAPEMTIVAQHVDSDSKEYRALAAYLQSR
jgi:cytochrome c553